MFPVTHAVRASPDIRPLSRSTADTPVSIGSSASSDASTDTVSTTDSSAHLTTDAPSHSTNDASAQSTTDASSQSTTDASSHPAVDAEPPRSAAATTTWVTVLATNALQTHSLVVCAPLTGKTHQLRAHLAMCGHPVLFDSFYQDLHPLATHNADTGTETTPPGAVTTSASEAEYLLHAWRMALPDPSRQDKRRVAYSLEAPPPVAFSQALVDLGFEVDGLDGVEARLQGWRRTPLLAGYIRMCGTGRALRKLDKELERRATLSSNANSSVSSSSKSNTLSSALSSNSNEIDSISSSAAARLQ